MHGVQKKTKKWSPAVGDFLPKKEQDCGENRV